ncbi:hypothetical protein LO772_22905 [Yinghuangia sp. ASG 101]|uniref:hypothetical protein n=1 Tax=Yinghuangia sp. ASG 101 TaxID=2896848 RepID=UPI001E28911E|nr:hypothetical protein [Yinghuangia sp. ASG 101]UGQ09747.1 hypothetical protein LO772_22905 [Yinghuangia sp. ASG 101]
MTLLRLADASGAADLAGYLVRLLRYDRAAVVHLRADGPVLGTFGRVPFGGGTSGVIALRTGELAESLRVDTTVSAGQLLDASTRAPADDAGEPPTVTVPPPVTGPPWTAMLPPRTGWTTLATLPIAGLVREVAVAVGRFRGQMEALATEERTRAVLDRIAEDVWSKTLGGTPGTHLPLRAAHAAASLGFLGAVDAGAEATVLAVGGWLRLDAPYGSVSVRRSGGPSLLLTPGAPGPRGSRGPQNPQSPQSPHGPGGRG